MKGNIMKQPEWEIPKAALIPKETDHLEKGKYGPIYPRSPACFGFTIIAKIKPGAKISDVHQAAMALIRSKGYEKYFIHGTSHHIGLEVHDVGDTSRPFEPNMVITVEPGIYIPEEQIGIRIEDDVLVTPAGYRLLSTFPKEIPEIESLAK